MGETAGVTQDVGSDPTVGGPDFDFVTCTLCGVEVVCEVCGQSGCSGFIEVEEKGNGEVETGEMETGEDEEDDDEGDGGGRNA